MMIKQALRFMAGYTPLRLGSWAWKLWIKAATHHRDPRRALEHVFQLENELDHAANRLAIRYDGGVHTKHRHTGYHDFFIQRIQPGEQVADIGCGKGELAREIAQRCRATVVAIDSDPAKVHFCHNHSRHERVTYLQQDALDWAPPQPFDVAVLSNVLEHIDKRVDFLRLAQSRLKPKRWLIRVPRYDRDWRVPLKQELNLPYFGDQTHFTEYTPEDFVAEMARAGMTITHLESRWAEIWAEVRYSPEPVIVSAAHGASARRHSADTVIENSRP